MTDSLSFSYVYIFVDKVAGARLLSAGRIYLTVTSHCTTYTQIFTNLRAVPTSQIMNNVYGKREQSTSFLNKNTFILKGMRHLFRSSS